MALARESSQSFQAATLALVSLGAVTMITHAFTGAGFGFHGDELQFMDDARHLAWGYVAYPPMTPFFARLSLDLFGTSIAGFRFFASLAQALAIILTGLMAREMGGGVRAQVLAGAAQVPYALGAGALMIYNSFDNICWILAAWFVIKLLRSEDARWWVAVGGAVGFGMMAKYAMAFFAAAIVAGFLVIILFRLTFFVLSTHGMSARGVRRASCRSRFIRRLLRSGSSAWFFVLRPIRRNGFALWGGCTCSYLPLCLWPRGAGTI
jgi:hypothetical protein